MVKQTVLIELVVVCLAMATAVDGQAVISLLEPLTVVVHRPGQCTLSVHKTGVAVSPVTIIVELFGSPGDSDASDFIGTSWTVQFAAGPSDATEMATFTVVDTGRPAPDHIYMVKLRVTSGDAIISQLGIATVTVAASNDPFGVFGFSPPLSVSTREIHGNSSVTLQIERTSGTFANVSISYQVNQTGIAFGSGADIIPAAGTVFFPEGISTQILTLIVLDDQFSENSEMFLVNLVSVVGGSSVDSALNSPRLNVTLARLTIIVLANDAPIRFSQSVFFANTTVITLDVYRGLSTDGIQRIGPTDTSATVYYFLLSSTARWGVEFTGINGSVGFSAGITVSRLSVNILTATLTEKSFRVLLSDPDGDVILADPSTALVLVYTSPGTVGFQWKNITIIDNGTTAIFKMRRDGGVFGVVTVRWSILQNVTMDGVINGINPTSGVAVFDDGESAVNISIAGAVDGSPQPVQVCRIVLGTVTGGATIAVAGPGGNDLMSEMTIVVADSGLAYGVVELDVENTSLVVIAGVRQLKVALVRRIGYHGDVDVAVSAALNSNITQGIFSSAVPAFGTFWAGQTSTLVNISVSNDVFLEIGFQFTVALNSAALHSKLQYGPYHSPQLGRTLTASVAIDSSAANGYIYFVNSTLPSSPILSDQLGFSVLLARSGNFGNVTVYWNITPSTAGVDTAIYISSPTGAVRFISGQESVLLPVSIIPTNLTRLAQQFIVTLTGVEPLTMAAIRPAARTVHFIVPDVGNPGGVFTFGPEMNDSYVVREELDTIIVSITRTDSTLAPVAIQYYIEPNGDAKFYGGVSVVYFLPGDSVKTVSIIAKDDGVPQLNVTYQLKLRLYGVNTHHAVVSTNHSIINITVLANNFPFGLFSFPSSNYSFTTVLQNKSSNIIAAAVTVVRLKGTYSIATVDWETSDSSDVLTLEPRNGTLTFYPGQSQLSILIRVSGNNVPQLYENFTIVLSNPTGQAVLGPYTATTLHVRSYDYAIQFNESSVRMLAASQRTVYIVRDGPLLTQVSVRYQTLTASASPLVDFVPMTGHLQFSAGEKWKAANISTLDGGRPVPDLVFYIILFDAQGDIVVTSNLTVVIVAHRNSNGIFHFVPPFDQSVTEGEVVSFQIIRDEGVYGSSSVAYEIQPMNGSVIAVDGSGPFQHSSGVVYFTDLQSSSALTLSVHDTATPHFNWSYAIQLRNVSGGPPSDPGRLHTNNVVVYLTILPDNFPYGVYRFGNNSLHVSVAEDSMASSANLSHVSLVVEKTAGAVDYLPENNLTELVLWEIYSYDIAGAQSLPITADLLMIASVSSPTSILVPAADHKRRLGTGTHVLQFSGCDGCYLKIPVTGGLGDFLQPQQAMAFTITSWFQSLATNIPVNGCIVSLMSSNGSVVYYSLGFTRLTNGTSLVQFTYTTNDMSTITISAAVNGLVLSDGLWHFLLTEISASSFTLMLDGNALFNSITQRPLILAGVANVDDVFLVGASSPRQSLFTGFLQDVRVYRQTLEAVQKQALLQMTSAADITPISGYLMYTQGNSRQLVTVATIVNNIPQPDRLFLVRLVSSSGLTPVSPARDSVATLTVLKSDNANGFFGFGEPCRPLAANRTDDVFTCSVKRDRGTYDTVTVTWQILPNVSAVDYFVNTTGSVSFQPGQTASTFAILLRTDSIPRFSNLFVLLLTSVVSSDGQIGSTATSGASINPIAASQNLTVLDRNFPYGLLQFSTSSVPPSQTDLLLPPAVEKPQRFVDAGVHYVSLLVVRAQGIVGRVSVEWRTVDGTARSSGKIPPDFVADAGLLIFADRQRFMYINITLLTTRNNTEPPRYFDIQLLNPTAGAAVGIASTISIIIQASTEAAGFFQFSDESLSVIAQEDTSSSIVAVHFLVLRVGGTVGDVNVTWTVDIVGHSSQSVEQTMLASHGVVCFTDRQQLANLTLFVLNDLRPTLDTNYVVNLTNVTKGFLGAAEKLAASLTILASDDPYGVYIIAAADRPVTVDSANTVVAVTVERKNGSGLFGTTSVSYTTLSPSESYPFLPALGSTMQRADYRDYLQTSGVVVFEPNQTSAVFNVTIVASSQSRPDVVVFTRLTSVTLMTGQQPRPVANSPRLGSIGETFAEIIIAAHGFPNGVLRLSNETVMVAANYVGPLVYIVRTDGLFGAVSIRFTVIPGSATEGVDYAVSTNQISFADGESLKLVPVSLIISFTPRVTRYFVVRLLNSTTGGAVVGVPTETTVYVQETYDAHGIFGFELQSITVNDPVSRSAALSVSVLRDGGSHGVVQVSWNATANGGAAVGSILPVSGGIYFLSGDLRSTLSASILPLNLMQGYQALQLTLTAADGGGRIDSSKSTMNVLVLPRSNPYGKISFVNASYVVIEPDRPVVQYIELSRSEGTYGDVFVHYTTSAADTIQEATSDGSTVFDYFNLPLTGTPLPLAASLGTAWNVESQPNPLQACASFCLRSQSCQSFQFSRQRVDCVWFPRWQFESLDNRTGYLFYVKSQTRTEALYSRLAVPQSDFIAEQTANITISNGESVGRIPVYVLPDNIPELTEKFAVQLTAVELAGPDIVGNPNYIPLMGNLSVAAVYIDANEEPNGVFVIYAATKLREVLVEVTQPTYAMQLFVQRLAGTFATVSVDWFIDLSLTTAVVGTDYIADGATFTFQPHETLKSLSVTILDSNVPSDDRVIVISLRNARGGAAIDAGNSSVSVIILAHDFVAGLIGFNRTTYTIREGDELSVSVIRTLSAVGRVTVLWHISPFNNDRPAQQRFFITSGSITFQQNETEKIVSLQLLVSNLPAVDDSYILAVTNISTVGVRETGAAAVDPGHSTAMLVVSGGNDPHGVFSFNISSLERSVNASNATFQLQVNRNAGTIDMVRLYYSIIPGSVGASDDVNTIPATPGVSFVGVTDGFVDIIAGYTMVYINVSLLDDGIPRPAQVFLVNLTQVLHVTEYPDRYPPRLASAGTTAKVTIAAGPGSLGVVFFPPLYASLAVESIYANVSLVIQRSRASFGTVSVFCFAQSLRNGATQNEDFAFSPQILVFGPSVSNRTIFVTVFDSRVPKPDRSFQITLGNPSDGLLIGNPNTATLTILATQLAAGTVNFDSDDDVVISAAASGVPASSTQAVLRLVRGPGVYGIVNVPFHVTKQAQNSSTTMIHVRPSSGVVTFLDRQSFTPLEISAVDGLIPDADEHYTVTLMTPDGGAILGVPNTRFLVLLRSGSPSGVMQLYLANTRNNSVSVESIEQTIFVDVVRTLGSLGTVSVDVITQPGTAVGQIGPDMHLSLVQQVSGASASRWYSYSVSGFLYLLLLNGRYTGPLTTVRGSTGAARPSANQTNGGPSVVYRWQGSLVSVQTLETDGAQSATAFTIESSTYLFIVNSGSVGRYETKSRLYLVQDDGSLVVWQDIDTQGGSDADYIADRHLLVLTNYRNNQGQTNVLSAVYRWDAVVKQFSSVQNVATKGAMAVKSLLVGNVTYVVIANSFDTALQTSEISATIYRIDSSDQLVLYQKIPTHGAVDVTSFVTTATSGMNSTYLVIANNRNNASSVQQNVVVYYWNEAVSQFQSLQSIPVTDVQHVYSFTVGTDQVVHLVISCRSGNTVIYRYDSQASGGEQFVNVWQGGPTVDFYPFAVTQPAGPLYLIAEAPVIDPLNAVERPNILHISMLGTSDFIPMAVTVIFLAGQTLMRTSVAVLKKPFIDTDYTTFYVRLSNPLNGALVSSDSLITVNILPSPNNCGLIAFSQGSVDMSVEMAPAAETYVTLNVSRVQGYSGTVAVGWQTATEGAINIRPSTGQVIFADGQSMTTIQLRITSSTSGLVSPGQVIFVSLTDVLFSNSTATGCPASLGSSDVARVTLLASGWPYGSVAWESMNYTVTRPNQTAATYTLYVTRTEGTQGHIRVYYQTQTAVSVPVDQQAVAGRDYIAASSTVDLADGVTRAAVPIVVLPNSRPELSKTFWLNITSAQLVIDTLSTANLWVHRPGDIVSVTVAEHGNARGIVQFNVTRNDENRVDVTEGDVVRLQVVRSQQSGGSLAVSWFAVPRQAGTQDYSPSSGTVTFDSGQQTADIVLKIADDQQEENLETFDIQLSSVSSGASIGVDFCVRVGILSSDSANGVFSIVPLQQTVENSANGTDPRGTAVFTIVRNGIVGVVAIYWRLDPEAADNFYPPLDGSIIFYNGEVSKRLALQTRTSSPSTIEGQEKFQLHLVHADNGAVISSTQGAATIIISATRSISGTIAIAPGREMIVVGQQPNGTVIGGIVQLIRTGGQYERVDVTWQILSGGGSFTVTQGISSFDDLQTATNVSIMPVPSTVSRLRGSYTLQLISVTNGARLSASLNETRVMIVVVASGFPRGLFQFGSPVYTNASRQQSQVSVDVTRSYGTAGWVRVFYTTCAGTAVSSSDTRGLFDSTSGWLTFEDSGVIRQTVSVLLRDNGQLEGPKTFFINLTQIELVSPSSDNYTVMNGLQLDQRPAIGSLSVVTVTVLPNDAAYGIVQFASSDGITVYADVGVTTIPLTRGPGTFGFVSVQYTTTDITARRGLDFVTANQPVSVWFTDSQTAAVINISLINDGLVHPTRQFTIRLTSPTGGTTLGTNTAVTVTIARSGYPNGKFGFKGSLLLTVAKPAVFTTVILTVERNGGLLGQQTISWCTMGPNNSSLLLKETDDISVYMTSSTQMTSGALYWADGEAGNKTISVSVKPYINDVWQIQKTFIIQICGIHGSPSTVGDGDISSTTGKVTFVIQKYGYANGVVGFSSVSLVERTFDRPLTGILTVLFPFVRTRGTVGNIQVEWRLERPTSVTSSQLMLTGFTQTSGNVTVSDQESVGQITVGIVTDNTPSLTEQFIVRLVSVTGGADLNATLLTAVFYIRYHDSPHGRFFVQPTLQSIVVQAQPSVQRQLVVNVTRSGGRFGSISVSFAIIYNQAVPGVQYTPPTGSAQFGDGQNSAVTAVNIDNAAFLALDSTFTITLTGAAYIGVGVTIPPDLLPGQTVAMVTVPAVAANSMLGFASSSVSVNQVAGTAQVQLVRQGVFGDVTVMWVSTQVSIGLPPGVSLGAVQPLSGSIVIRNGQDTGSFTVQPVTQFGTAQVFILTLPSVPTSSVASGARLLSGHTVCMIEPRGVVQFATQSRDVTITYSPGSTTGVAGSSSLVQTTLTVDRLFGSLDAIQIHYRVASVNVAGDWDYSMVHYSSISMLPGQISTNIVLQINTSLLTNTNNYFAVNLTDAAVSSSNLSLYADNSPRVSSLFYSARLVVQAAGRPYGLFSVVAQTVIGSRKIMEPGVVDIVVTRTGGTYGDASVRVRTVGGGEPWDDLIDLLPALRNNETIGGVLSAHSSVKQSTVGVDYIQLDTVLDFTNGQTSASCTLNILNDTVPEDDELVYVYITSLTSDVTVGRPSKDNGKQGFTIVTILQNNFANGWVGFNELQVIADEDSNQAIVLSLQRQTSSASLGQLVIYWRVVDPLSPRSSEPFDLSTVLVATDSQVVCSAASQLCTFTLAVINNQVPTNETWFLIDLYLGPESVGAQIDPTRSFCNVTLLASDHPNGLLQFALTSRSVYVDRNASAVQLTVSRLGYNRKTVLVTFVTRQLSAATDVTIAGVRVYPAVEDVDYVRVVSTLVFDIGSTSESITVNLPPPTQSTDNELYPKMFQVALVAASGLAELSESVANVTLVDSSNIDLWSTWSATDYQLNNDSILALLVRLAGVVHNSLTADQLSVISAVLDRLLNIAENHTTRFSADVNSALLDVFCILLQDGRRDATRGFWQLSQLLTRFVYTLVDDRMCDISFTLGDCSQVFGLILRKQSADIAGLTWDARDENDITLPATLPSLVSDQCVSAVLLAYYSEQWFTSNQNNQLLSSVVLSTGIKSVVDSDVQLSPISYKIFAPANTYPPPTARCVYYDDSLPGWTTGNNEGHCHVVNNLILGVDRHVECTCSHTSRAYAVLVDVNRSPSTVGYPIWFHVSCFVTMLSVITIVVTHYLGSLFIRPLFTASLHTHLCFAIFATQLCYVVDAFVSPYSLLADEVDNNARCIVMSLFLHYFFLAQFTCLLSQAVNLYNVLIINDEQTDRHLFKFCLLNWGVPMLIVALFYLIVYLIYRYTTTLPVQLIYGDVTDTRDICFITNIYAAIGGIFVPAFISVLVTAVILMYAFRLSLLWQSYDDIYGGHANVYELRMLVAFYVLLVMLLVWAGLHMVFQRLWLLVLFSIFNFSFGIYTFIVHVLLRMPCCRLQCLDTNRQKPLYIQQSDSPTIPSIPPHQPDILPSRTASGFKNDLSEQIILDNVQDNDLDLNDIELIDPQLDQPTMQVSRSLDAGGLSPGNRRRGNSIAASITRTTDRGRHSKSQLDDIIDALGRDIGRRYGATLEREAERQNSDSESSSEDSITSSADHLGILSTMI